MGRKYGRGKYGAKTYDLGPNVCPIEPWLPVTTIPEEIWESVTSAPVEVWGATAGKSKTWVPEVDKTPIYQGECNV